MTLRRLLLLLVGAGTAYVAVIALLITARISPTASALQRHSTRILAAHDVMSSHVATVGQTIAAVHQVIVGARAGAPVPDSVIAGLTGPIRARLDSASTMQYAMELEAVPAEIRMKLASAAQSESRFGFALLDAVAELQLGHHDLALQRLRQADAMRARTERLLQAAQRAALSDMVRRERDLGDAATDIGRAIFWWLLIGGAMLPLLARFVRRRLHDPLHRLEAALGRVAAGDLSARLTVAHGDEVGRLTGHFNEMTTLLAARAEDERRRRENLAERLGHLLEESANQILVVASDTLRIRQASRGAAEHLLSSAEQLRDQTLEDLLPPADTPRARRLLDSLRAGTLAQAEIETRLRRSDGRSFPATVNVQLSRAEDPPVYVVIAHDISERRESERLREALREFSVSHGALMAAGSLERLLRQITAVTASVLNAERVSIWTLDGGNLHCADQYQRLSARHSAQLDQPESCCPGFLAALDSQRVISVADTAGDARMGDLHRSGTGAMLAAAVRRNGVLGGILRVEHAGPRPWTAAEESFVASMADFVAIAHEAAERRSLQTQLVESQRLESVGQLAGGVAHDFNNLLTAILSHVELARVQFDEAHPAASDLDGIQHATLRAADLTRQLLTFARRQVIRPRVVDLNALTRHMDKLLRRLIGEDIELVTLLDPELRTTCVDPIHFEQVIVNLAVNARDAMPRGGKLTVRTSNIVADADYVRGRTDLVPGAYVMLAVTDDGVGMDTEVRARVFEPFFTTKDRSKGTGLGLATVYGIVRQAEGRIYVHSEPGVGTTFEVFLPAAQDPVGEEEVAKPQPLPRGTETLLLVEDEPQIRTVLARGLSALGYRVLAAGNGAEALEVSRRHEGPIQLLLTDVVMPLMNGRDLAEQLIVERPDTMVVFMSGYAEDAIVHHGVVQPGITFLSKPFTVAELSRRLRETLDAAAPAPDDDLTLCAGTPALA